MTFVISLDEILEDAGSVIEQVSHQLHRLTPILQETCIDIVSRYGFLVPTTTFPKCISVFTNGMIKEVQEIVSEYTNDPRSVGIPQREYAVFLESLVIFN